jgi:hypothetical protein
VDGEVKDAEGIGGIRLKSLFNSGGKKVNFPEMKLRRYPLLREVYLQGIKASTASQEKYLLNLCEEPHEG